MLPQLWMMSRAGGAKLLTCHYVAAMAISRSMNFVFWYHGYPELAVLEGEEGTPGNNLPGYGVLIAHVIQLLLMADFLWRYVAALSSNCIGKGHNLAAAQCAPYGAIVS